jgi:hypothetical protein
MALKKIFCVPAGRQMAILSHVDLVIDPLLFGIFLLERWFTNYQVIKAV